MVTLEIYYNSKQKNIPIDDIPKNAKNGDTLVYKNGKFIIK